MSSRSFGTILLLTLTLLGFGAGQDLRTTVPLLQTRQIDLTNTVPLVGLPFTGVFAYPFVCSSDGDSYAGVLSFNKEGRPISPIPGLYRVSPTAEVKHIPQPVPTDYKQLDTPSFFAGATTLVSLIRAAQPIAQQRARHSGADFFLSVTDSDGDHPHLIRLELNVNPIKAAVFDSGEFVILGLDRTNFEPKVALLSPEGGFIKYLDVFSTTAEHTINPAGSEKEGIQNAGSSVGAASFVPWGLDILLAAPGIANSTLYRFRASGVVEKIYLKLPEEQQLVGIVGSGGRDTWVVRARSAESSKQFAKSHVIENPQEFLYEVNPSNGEILKRLDLTGPHPGEVTCAADGKLSAIYVVPSSQPGGPDRLVLASGQR